MKKIIYLLFSVLLFSCEDVIDLEVKQGENQLVIDGWLTDKEEDQVIKLSISQGYFDQAAPISALGATVIVFEGDSTAHKFTDVLNNGSYTLAKKEAGFLKTGGKYLLYVNFEGSSYTSISKLKRVPPIDSIAYENFSYPIEPGDDSPQEGFLSQFYSTDPMGEGDTYWIKTIKNGLEINDPSGISIAYDGGFSPGAQSDGLLFILPIRESINDGLYLHGDTLQVELLSVTEEAFYYLNQVRQESSNAGIFATAPANIPTNIFNAEEGAAPKALGFFGVSAVSTFYTIIDSTLAHPEK